ncbi:FtsX-like permease family protein [Spiroplasma sp. DGKH1]|uniref:FtsX-like permease family protein n=1 Tax=Spiroplasma sp. DGKH1 TaxID=3050074 RepID=UPI0034C66606
MNFGIVVIIFSLILTIIFIKKELNAQKNVFGILISLGLKKKLLYLTVSIIYLIFLVLAVFIGYGFSFFLQYVLTKEISNIIFIPNSFVIFDKWSLIILGVIFPVVLFLTTYFLTMYFLTQPPLELLKPFKVSTTLLKTRKGISLIKNYDLKLILSFFQTNWKKSLANFLIFFLVTLITFSSFFIMSSYNYSKTISNMKFKTEKIKSVFSGVKQNNDNLFKSLANNLDYDEKEQIYWVSYQTFQKNINIIYYQATLNDFLNNKNLYHYFLTPDQVKEWANTPGILAIIKDLNPNLSLLFDLALPKWNASQEYPFLTFGFKLYEPSKTVLYNDVGGFWEMDNLSVPTNFRFEGFFADSMDNWIYYQNIWKTDALKELKEQSNDFVNVILPMQIAKILNVKYGDIIPASIQNDNLIGTFLWNKLSLRVVGVNYYDYVDNAVFIDAASFYHYLLYQYHQVYPATKITISSIENLATGSFSTQGLEVLKNIAFYSSNQKYDDYSSYNLIGEYPNYVMNNFPPYGNKTDLLTTLLKTIKMLSILFYIIAIAVLFLLVFLIFDENKYLIINLKILGYNNHKISSYFMLPYLIFFIFFLIINILISFYLVEGLFKLLFKISHTLFLTTIPYLDLVLASLVFLAILSLIYLFAYHFITKQPFMLILSE